MERTTFKTLPMEIIEDTNNYVAIDLFNDTISFSIGDINKPYPDVSIHARDIVAWNMKTENKTFFNA